MIISVALFILFKIKENMQITISFIILYIRNNADKN